MEDLGINIEGSEDVLLAKSSAEIEGDDIIEEELDELGDVDEELDDFDEDLKIDYDELPLDELEDGLELEDFNDEH